jgi:hypothetical protein
MSAGTRICPLCEAVCGLLLEIDGPRVLSVTANPDDVFSQGHASAKGLGLGRRENDRPLLAALGTRSSFSPASVDTMPKSLALDRLRRRREERRGRQLMITRRQRRGMHTWPHNPLPQPDDVQCALWKCRADATRAGLLDGDQSS